MVLLCGSLRCAGADADQRGRSLRVSDAHRPPQHLAPRLLAAAVRHQVRDKVGWASSDATMHAAGCDHVCGMRCSLAPISELPAAGVLNAQRHTRRRGDDSATFCRPLRRRHLLVGVTSS
eukprot:2463627-Rhodomonas_salina.3